MLIYFRLEASYRIIHNLAFPFALLLLRKFIRKGIKCGLVIRSNRLDD